MLVYATFWDTDLFKILVTASVTSVFTALATEPIKVWRQNQSRKREIRKCVLAEASLNLTLLNTMIEIVEGFSKPGTIMPMCKEFSTEFQRTAYKNAQNDFYLFNQTAEVKWIDKSYWALEHTYNVCLRRPLVLNLRQRHQ
jgi:hypothetical protein